MDRHREGTRLDEPVPLREPGDRHRVGFLGADPAGLLGPEVEGGALRRGGQDRAGAGRADEHDRSCARTRMKTLIGISGSQARGRPGGLVRDSSIASAERFQRASALA